MRDNKREGDHNILGARESRFMVSGGEHNYLGEGVGLDVLQEKLEGI